MHNVTNGLTQPGHLSHAINAFLQVKKRWEHPHHISPPQYLIVCADAWFLRVVAFLPTLTLACPPATLHIALLFLALVIYLSMRRLPLDPSYPVAHFLPVGVCRIRCSLLVSCTCLLSWIVCLHDSKWLYLWFCSCLSFLSGLLFTLLRRLPLLFRTIFARVCLFARVCVWRSWSDWDIGVGATYGYIILSHVLAEWPRRCLHATAPHRNCFGQLAFVAIQCGSTMMYSSELKHLELKQPSFGIAACVQKQSSLDFSPGSTTCIQLHYTSLLQAFYPMILLLGGWIEKNMQCYH